MIYATSISSGFLVTAILLLQISAPGQAYPQILGAILGALALAGYHFATMSQEQIWGRALFTVLTVISGYISLLHLVPLLIAGT